MSLYVRTEQRDGIHYSPSEHVVSVRESTFGGDTGDVSVLNICKKDQLMKMLFYLYFIKGSEQSDFIYYHPLIKTAEGNQRSACLRHVRGGDGWLSGVCPCCVSALSHPAVTRSPNELFRRQRSMTGLLQKTRLLQQQQSTGLGCVWVLGQQSGHV